MTHERMLVMAQSEKQLYRSQYFCSGKVKLIPLCRSRLYETYNLAVSLAFCGTTSPIREKANSTQIPV